MAEIQPACDIAISWEGPWEPYAKASKRDTGNFINKKPMVEANFRGTAYGLVHSFLNDYVIGSRNPTLEQMMTITKSVACDIYEKTIWNWMRGGQINDQDTANVLFDWLVIRQLNSESPMMSINSWLRSGACATLLNVKLLNWGTRTAKDKDNQNGFYVFTQATIDLINAQDPKKLRARILKCAARKSVYSTRGRRKYAFQISQQGNFVGITQQEYEQRLEAELLEKQKSKKNRKNLTSEAQNTEGEGNTLLLIIGIAAATKAAKLW